MYFRYTPVIDGNTNKKYVAMIYTNGQYKRLKPYIYIDPVPFYEANNNPVFVSGSDNNYEQFYVYANGKLASIEDLKFYDVSGAEL